MSGSDAQFQALRNTLASTAASFPQRLGIRVSPEAQVLLAARIDAAARQLVEDGLAHDEEAVKRAKSQLMSLLFRAAAGTDEVRAGGSQSLGDVDDRLLDATLKRLCPGFWPFC